MSKTCILNLDLQILFKYHSHHNAKSTPEIWKAILKGLGPCSALYKWEQKHNADLKNKGMQLYYKSTNDRCLTILMHRETQGDIQDDTPVDIN